MNSGTLIMSWTRSLVMKSFIRRASNVNEDLTGQACPGEKMQKMAEKLRQKTPLGRLEELEEGKHPYQEKEPLFGFPDGINPTTGEKGGPRGPEPTRYGDWERKGRVSDF